MLTAVEMNEDLQLFHLQNEDGGFQTKGLIYDHKQNLIISNFPVPKEFTVPQDMLDYLQPTFPLTAYEAIEGTLIRVFYFNEEWKVCTSSRLDAFACHWSAPFSFGEQFEEYASVISGVPLEVFLCSLDTQKKYFFILPTEDTNRIAKFPDPSDQEKIYLIGIEDTEGVLLRGEELENAMLEEVNIWQFPKKVVIDSYETLFNVVEFHETNLIMFNGSEVVKLIGSEYSRRVGIRNNEPDVLLRYVQLYLKKDSREEMDYMQVMYPEMNFVELVDRGILELTRFIHKKYLVRYIKKEYVNVPKVYFEIMRLCHELHVNENVVVTKQVVTEIILKQGALKIVTLIRNFLF